MHKYKRAKVVYDHLDLIFVSKTIMGAETVKGKSK